MRERAKLTEGQIATFLVASPTWSQRGEEITKRYECASFQHALDFVVAVGALAEAADHHPDIEIRYRAVLIALTTHDAGGLTYRDTDLATAIDAASERFVAAAQ